MQDIKLLINFISKRESTCINNILQKIVNNLDIYACLFDFNTDSSKVEDKSYMTRLIKYLPNICSKYNIFNHLVKKLNQTDLFYFINILDKTDKNSLLWYFFDDTTNELNIQYLRFIFIERKDDIFNDIVHIYGNDIENIDPDKLNDVSIIISEYINELNDNELLLHNHDRKTMTYMLYILLKTKNNKFNDIISWMTDKNMYNEIVLMTKLLFKSELSAYIKIVISRYPNMIDSEMKIYYVDPADIKIKYSIKYMLESLLYIAMKYLSIEEILLVYHKLPSKMINIAEFIKCQSVFYNKYRKHINSNKYNLGTDKIISNMVFESCKNSDTIIFILSKLSMLDDDIVLETFIKSCEISNNYKTIYRLFEIINNKNIDFGNKLTYVILLCQSHGYCDIIYQLVKKNMINLDNQELYDIKKILQRNITSFKTMKLLTKNKLVYNANDIYWSIYNLDQLKKYMSNVKLINNKKKKWIMSYVFTYGKIDMIMYLMNNIELNHNYHNYDNYMRLSIKNNNIDGVRYLINNDVHIDMNNISHTLTECNEIEIIKLILDNITNEFLNNLWQILVIMMNKKHQNIGTAMITNFRINILELFMKKYKDTISPNDIFYNICYDVPIEIYAYIIDNYQDEIDFTNSSKIFIDLYETNCFIQLAHLLNISTKYDDINFGIVYTLNNHLGVACQLNGCELSSIKIIDIIIMEKCKTKRHLEYIKEYRKMYLHTTKELDIRIVNIFFELIGKKSN